MFYKIVQKVIKHFGYFCKIICHQELPDLVTLVVNN